MKPRVLKYRKNQTYFMPGAAEEVWQPVAEGHRLLRQLGLALESIDPAGRLTPVRCLILAQIGRQSGLGITSGRLSRELGIPRPSLTHHLYALGRDDLIARSLWPLHDRRKCLLVLTEKGAQVLDAAAALLVELTCGGEWPAAAPTRNAWNQRRLPPVSGPGPAPES